MALLVDEDGAILRLDANMGETFTFADAVTAKPVALRSPTTDHAQPLQSPLELTARVTKNPLPGQAQALPGVTPGALDGSRRIIAVENWLQARRGRRLTFSGLHRVRRNLMLKSVRIAATAPGYAEFKISLVEVVFATTETVTIPARRKGTAELADEEPSGQGTVDGEDAPGARSESYLSLVASLFD